jgi:hypothetical protein
MSRKLLFAVGAALLGAAIWSPGGASAEPSRFLYEVCDSALPGGNTPAVRFVQNPGTAFAASNTCSQPGGSLSIAATGTIQATFSLWSVTIPVVHGGKIESTRVSANFCSRGTGASGWAFTNVPGPWPTDACIDLYKDLQGSYGGGWIFLGCTNAGGSACPGGASISAHYIAATEVDTVPPEVKNLGGSLLDGGAQRGHQTIEADLADAGGGLSEENIYVNGVAAMPASQESCSTVFANNMSVYGPVVTSVSPCPSARQMKWTLDTQAYPFRDGENSVTVCASDFSTLNDPNRGCAAAQTIRVDNSCTASAVDGGELLSAQFEGSHSDTYTAPYGRGAKVSGTLSTNADDPVAGATLCVKVATIGLDDSPEAVGTVTTDAGGNFSYEVPPGPDRQIVLGYRHDAHQVARAVRFYAHVRPTLKLAPSRLRNGHRVQMWGQLPGPRPGRRIVVVQASTPGSRRWITFRKATTNDGGVFRASYRFKSTRRRIRYRFRAVVPAQDSYPYVGGASKPASVIVRP